MSDCSAIVFAYSAPHWGVGACLSSSAVTILGLLLLVALVILLVLLIVLSAKRITKLIKTISKWFF